jgi:hypothetical protein
MTFSLCYKILYFNLRSFAMLSCRKYCQCFEIFSYVQPYVNTFRRPVQGRSRRHSLPIRVKNIYRQPTTKRTMASKGIVTVFRIRWVDCWALILVVDKWVGCECNVSILDGAGVHLPGGEPSGDNVCARHAANQFCSCTSRSAQTPEADLKITSIEVSLRSASGVEADQEVQLQNFVSSAAVRAGAVKRQHESQPAVAVLR